MNLGRWGGFQTLEKGTERGGGQLRKLNEQMQRKKILWVWRRVKSLARSLRNRLKKGWNHNMKHFDARR